MEKLKVIFIIVGIFLGCSDAQLICIECEGDDCFQPTSGTPMVTCSSTSCYIGVNSEGKSVRGCTSDFANTDLCSTSNNSTAECFICGENLCNSIMYPTTGRLQCYTCAANATCELSDASVSYCSTFSPAEKCVTVFSKSEDVVVSRGCSSELDTPQVCDSSANCLQCSEDKCNTDASKVNINKCMSCKSNEDPACSTGTSIGFKSCSTSQCYTRLYVLASGDQAGRQIVERGCLADLTASTIESCEGTNCNSALFPADRISCKVCAGAECLISPLPEKVCDFYTANEACITVFGESGSAIYRDCYADAPPATQAFCDDASNLECSKCSASNCNVDTQRRGSKCFKCAGVECFTPSLATAVDCELGCYLGVNENGETVRDCAGVRECDPSDSSCVTCDDDFCNGITFPLANRRSCIACSGYECVSGGQESKYCEIFAVGEHCVTVFDSASTVIEKGCSSTISYVNATGMTQCNFDDCNVANSPSEPGLCVACNSASDTNCIVSPLEAGLSSCSTDECYARVLTSGVVERGCAASLTAGSCSGDNCKLCTGERCNVDSVPANRQSCYKCSGEECLLGFGRQETCLGASSDGCVTVFGEDSQPIYRNCYSDSNSVVQSICDDDSDLECSKCSTSNCNTDTRRGGTKCFTCEGNDCFTPSLTSVRGCPSSCYLGVNSAGQTVRGCASTSLSCNSTDCLTCADDFCNGVIFPTADRRSCLKCSGYECTTSMEESSYCEVFASSEPCVTIFDSSNNVVERGCSSSVLSTLASRLTCNFDNCNTHTSPAEAYNCIACSSTSDPRCILSPMSAGSAACTTDECYSLALDSGVVERGCGAAITNCSGSNCITCTGDRCNTVDVPSSRQSCYKCSGASCAVNLGITETCLSHIGDSCITVFGEDSRAIYRNCFSDVNSVVQALCDDASNIECVKCTSNNCNTETKRPGTKCFGCSGIECFQPSLADVVDCSLGCYVGVNTAGETVRGCNSTALSCPVGATNCLFCTDDFCNAIAYPTLNRRSCLHCTGLECAMSEETSLCEVFGTNETCVTVFDTSNRVVERGCMSSLSAVGNANRLSCTFDNCNTHNTIAETFYCVACDSKSDSKCITNPKDTRTIACTSSECYSQALTSGVVQRGCVASLTSECTGSNCIKCNGTQCNTVNVPVDRQSCWKCSGSSCSNNTARVETCLGQASSSCITIFNEYSQPIFRDCYADVNSAVQSTCDDENSLECTKCTSRNCNTQTTRRGTICLRCNGAECLSPSAASDAIACVSGGCYVGLNSLGQTVRDCASSFQNSSTICASNDTEAKSCLVCNDDFCNAIAYPMKERAECHVCIGQSCAASEDNLNFCSHFYDRCVTVFDDTQAIIERGCLSSLTNKKQCIVAAGSCVGCVGSGCNTATSLSSKTCVSCNSQTDPNCVQNPPLAPTKTCSTGDGCYTRLVSGHLERGCVEDLQNATCTTANECAVCSSSDKCNAENFPSNRLSCYNCASAVECQTPMKKLCNIHKENDLCVTIFDNYVPAIKGCLADQSASAQNQCASSNTTCPACSNSNCNTDTVRKDEACISCSSDIDPNCAQRPSTLAVKRCFTVSNGQCYTQILNGITRRGCKGDLTIACNSGNCTLASGLGANREIFPANRLKCHHCSSLVDSHCAAEKTAINEILPCKTFIPTEKCIKITSSNGVVTRGCEADFRAGACNGGRCETCNEEGCNKSFAVKTTFSVAIIMLAFVALWLVQ